MSARARGERDAVTVLLAGTARGSDPEIGLLSRARAASGTAIAFGYRTAWLADLARFAIERQEAQRARDAGRPRRRLDDEIPADEIALIAPAFDHGTAASR